MVKTYIEEFQPKNEFWLLLPNNLKINEYNIKHYEKLIKNLELFLKRVKHFFPEIDISHIPTIKIKKIKIENYDNQTKRQLKQNHIKFDKILNQIVDIIEEIYLTVIQEPEKFFTLYNKIFIVFKDSPLLQELEKKYLIKLEDYINSALIEIMENTKSELRETLF